MPQAPRRTTGATNGLVHWFTGSRRTRTPLGRSSINTTSEQMAAMAGAWIGSCAAAIYDTADE